MNSETAALGGGCFWCLEAVYQELQGVKCVVSGYMGGHVDRPSYEEVCTGRTGHAEVVQIEFDPDVVSYPDVLDVFFTIHDPTTKDRQGNDIGPQYRSVIFFHSEEQRRSAEEAVRAAQAIWPGEIVTEVLPAQTFYPAEDYHRNYFATNPRQPYCAFVVAPKVTKFRQKFAAKMRHA